MNDFDDIPPGEDEMELAIMILRAASGERLNFEDYDTDTLNEAATNLINRGLILGYLSTSKKVKWTALTASGKKALKDYNNRQAD